MTGTNDADAMREAATHLLFYGRDFSDLVIERAAGSYLYDGTGRAILDFSSGQMCATLGHNHPVIVEAIERACREAIHLESTKLSPPVLELARDLCAILPAGLQRAMFLSTGGEANDAAIRLAKLHSGGFEIVALGGSYHGMTAGSQASTYAHGRRGYGPTMPGNFVVPGPNAYRCPIRHCDKACDKTCLKVGFEGYDQWSSGAPAALIAEPIQSTAGIVEPPEGYFPLLRELCDARGLLLILDEAQTGLGRVGANFAFEQDGIVPDILTLSKTLGAGVPLAAIVTSAGIGEDARAKRFSFYTSHVSDPLPARVGVAVVGLLVRERLAGRAKAMGERLRLHLEEIAQRYEVVGEIRGRGLLLGLELVEDRATKAPALDLLARVTARCLALGLNLNKAGGPYAVWRIAPPLTVSADEIDRGAEILDTAMRDCGAR